jgi:hypothetical protein
MGGALFEGLIIGEVWKTFFNCGKRPTAFFWRSQGGLEVDLIVQAQGKLWPIEIKMTSTPSAHHIKSLERFKKLAGDEASPLGVIVCRTKDKVDLPKNNIAMPWFAFFEWLEDIISS